MPFSTTMGGLKRTPPRIRPSTVPSNNNNDHMQDQIVVQNLAVVLTPIAVQTSTPTTVSAVSRSDEVPLSLQGQSTGTSSEPASSIIAAANKRVDDIIERVKGSASNCNAVSSAQIDDQATPSPIGNRTRLKCAQKSAANSKLSLKMHPQVTEQASSIPSMRSIDQPDTVPEICTTLELMAESNDGLIVNTDHDPMGSDDSSVKSLNISLTPSRLRSPEDEHISENQAKRRADSGSSPDSSPICSSQAQPYAESVEVPCHSDIGLSQAYSQLDLPNVEPHSVSSSDALLTPQANAIQAEARSEPIICLEEETLFNDIRGMDVRASPIVELLSDRDSVHGNDEHAMEREVANSIPKTAYVQVTSPISDGQETVRFSPSQFNRPADIPLPGQMNTQLFGGINNNLAYGMTATYPFGPAYIQAQTLPFASQQGTGPQPNLCYSVGWGNPTSQPFGNHMQTGLQTQQGMPNFQCIGSQQSGHSQHGPSPPPGFTSPQHGVIPGSMGIGQPTIMQQDPYVYNPFLLRQMGIWPHQAPQYSQQPNHYQDWSTGSQVDRPPNGTTLNMCNTTGKQGVQNINSLQGALHEPNVLAATMSAYAESNHRSTPTLVINEDYSSRSLELLTPPPNAENTNP